MQDEQVRSSQHYSQESQCSVGTEASVCMLNNLEQLNTFLGNVYN